ncbi:MAG: alpha/beta fold hydrolase [Alphaproteobacteria bacterium]
MILFLPPAPHTGSFFDTIRESLSDIETQASTYPGYGDVPATTSTIQAYALSLLPQDNTVVVGFHTGCLVALEMALQYPNIGPLILVDIPFFDIDTAAKHAAALDAENPQHDAFRAAFAYDTSGALEKTDHAVTCVATESSLFEPTKLAASMIKNSSLIERRDITKPAFGNPAMAQLIRELTS